MTKRDLLAAIFITFLWGMNFSVIKLGVSNLDPFTLTALRFFFVAFPLIFFIKRPDCHFLYVIAYGLIFGVGLWGVATLAIKFGATVGESSLILQSSAFFTVFMGAVLLRERISKSQLFGGVIAFSGIFIIINSGEESSTLLGSILVILAALSWSFANIIIKISKPKEMLSFLIWSSIFSPIPLLFMAFFISDITFNLQSIIELNRFAWFSILFQAYPVTLFGYWVWNKLLFKYSISTVAPISLLVPVFGVLGAFVFYAEPVNSDLLISGVLIVIGLMINMQVIKLPTFKREQKI